ncbi:heliorhodopsin HeR [Jeotgalibaca sp. MA1X17-3]|uniref:heliorhodopsin HeR n=1 Tax=Jeotgalibaca sp. MA1X17-3 TaxID=2908211 RepID=UPI001F3A5267|nr:heliorhodopsin HeR [Jeotgalibaca sp. MA1X17-3]UJF15484.1 heliorhodopsin HeR [Jeotgalibaca sp. MA1X17-3]
MSKEITYPSLRKFNGIMGVLHLVQGSLMLWFALFIDKISSFKIPIRSYFLSFDQTQMSLVTDTKELFDFPFGVMVSLFLFLSAFAHFIIISPWGNRRYNKDLENGMNRFRWYEYALSSSLMIVLIALLFGVYDVGSLLLIFGLNAAMNLFGLDMEEMNKNREKVNWKPFVFGSIAGVIPWIVILLYAFGNSNPSEVPWFVYALAGSYFVFFNLFPINMVLQYKKVGKWESYLYGEKGYIVLSLVAKTILAWIAFAGVMQP